MTTYHPPCNCSFGSVAKRIRCCGAPGHKGHHHNREEGLRWNDGGKSVSRCTWKDCTDPDRQLQNGEGATLHLCPGKPAELRLLATLQAEGWQ